MSAFAAFFTYAATTRGVTVRVQPHYLPDQSDPANRLWAWSYHVRLENHSAQAVQLLTRHWIITDALGRTQEVRGEGVVGDQPLLQPGAAYDYVSGCPLTTPSGEMRGSYGMVDGNGARFDAVIPAFELVSPDSRRMGN